MSTTELKERAKLRADLKDLLNDFSENSTAHGPPKIVQRKFILAKLFWSCLFITGICFFGYFSYKLTVKYMNYETTTDIELTFDVLKFPAVSFCNHNQFRLDRIPQDLRSLTEDFIMSDRFEMFGGEDYFYDYFMSNPTDSPLYIPWWLETTQSVSSSPEYSTSVTEGNQQTTQVTGEDRRRRKRFIAELDDNSIAVMKDMEGFYLMPNLTSKAEDITWFSETGSPSSGSSILLNVTEYVASYTSDSMLRGMGHDIEEMLQGCTFQGRTCGPEDFYQFYDRKYGNCYTFNSGMDQQVAKVTSPGAPFGLSLTLFINQPMYVPALSKQSGVRVLLHRQGEVPLVAEEGFNAPPGMESAIAVRYIEISRMPGEKYSNCTKQSLSEGSFHEFYPGNYTQQACLKTCLQKGIIKECGCANALYRSPPDVEICNVDKVTCLEEVEENLLESDVCLGSCPIQCWESQYQHSISTSQWPSNNYEPYLEQTLKTRGKALKKMLEASDRDGLREEFVKLEIYFDNLNFYRYKERPSMTFEDLIGNIGGHLGLWIGMSVISFVEVFELIVSLFAVCAKALSASKQNKVEQMKQFC
ncbi:SCNN1D [Bugula neritina]|uniref:SCNN1D n=1 Tax=Bugula neritina TaxID=10212 RepID=A0A7J7KC75_BUGNE|nr:SCNN1D [Bugula neritina]